MVYPAYRTTLNTGRLACAVSRAATAPRPGIGWAGANTPSPVYVSATTNAKVITRRICIPPNAIAPATAGGRRQALRLSRSLVIQPVCVSPAGAETIRGYLCQEDVKS